MGHIIRLDDIVLYPDAKKLSKKKRKFLEECRSTLRQAIQRIEVEPNFDFNYNGANAIGENPWEIMIYTPLLFDAEIRGKRGCRITRVEFDKNAGIELIPDDEMKRYIFRYKGQMFAIRYYQSKEHKGDTTQMIIPPYDNT